MMKTILLLIAILALYSCTNPVKPNEVQEIEEVQGTFQDFAAEFESSAPLWTVFDDLEVVKEGGKSFNLRKYKNLFQEEAMLKDNPKEVTTIAYYYKIKRHKDFELFIITANKKYYILTVNKTKQKIVHAFEVPKDYTLYRFHFDKLYAEEGEEVELTCRSSKLGKWSNYAKETLLHYEHIYYFTEEGKFVFSHTDLDRKSSLKSLPSLNKISGEYRMKSESHSFHMTVRDSTAIGTVPIEIYTHDTKSGCIITYETDDKIQGNKLIHIKDDKICFELTFVNEKVHVFLRECIEECEHAYCDVKMTAEKVE